MKVDVNVTPPKPEVSALNRHYWEELARGVLSFQRCKSCGYAWAPAREDCPQCLGCEWNWEGASGGATLVSWVVYHHAYHGAFSDRIPYTVAVVQLDEGPRMISSVLGDPATFRIEQRLALRIEAEGEFAVPRFAIAESIL